MTTRYRRRAKGLLMGALLALVAAAPLVGLTQTAQPRAPQSESPPTVPVRGHAPQVTVSAIVNETVPGQAPAVGHVLRATATATDPDGDTVADPLEYRWLRGATPIGTQASYVTVAADLGQTLTVEVTAHTDPAITDPASGTATATVDVRANSAPVASNLVVEGRPTVGSTLTATYTYSDADGDLEGASTIDWCRTSSNCRLGSGRTYVVQAGDAGQLVEFAVTPKSVTGTPNAGTVTYAPPVSITAEAAPTATAVSVSGTVAVGSVLTGHYTYADANGDPEGASTFQWYRADDAAGTANRTPIGGATAKTYTLVAADRNKFLVFEVTPVAAEGTPNTGAPVSAVSAQLPGTAPVASNLRIEGDMVVDQVVRAVYDYADADGDLQGGTTFRWCHVSSGSCLPESTDATFTLRTVDAGQRMEVRVIPKSASGVPNAGAQVTYQATPAVVAAIAATANTTAQVLTVGTAMASFSPLAASGGRTPYTYEITSGTLPAGLALNAGTGAVTGTPTAQRAAANVVFRVKDANGVVASTTSTVSFTVNAAITATANTTAQVLTVGTAMASFSPLAASGGRTPYTYEITSGTLPAGLALNAGTGAVTGTPTAQRAAANVAFRVKDANGVVASATSTVSFTVNGRAPVASNVQISGTASVGSVLTGSFTYADADGDAAGTHAYQWYRADDAAGTSNRTPIAGATGTSYTVVATDQLKWLVFEVTPKSATGTPNTGLAVNRVTPQRAVGSGPEALNPVLTGQAIVGETLTLSYTYRDADGDPEGNTLIDWCYASQGCNANPARSMVIPASALGQQVTARVTPVAPTSNPPVGTMVQTPPTAVVTMTTATANTTAQVLTAGSAMTSFSPLTGVTGGKAPYTYEITSGTLPAGLTLNAGNGAVTGIPTAVRAAANVVFRVKDANGVVATTTSTVSFTVQGRAPVATAVSVVNNSLPGIALHVRDVARATYSFSDADGDAELGTSFQWRRNGVAIPGATASTYTLVSADGGTTLSVTITPGTDAGTSNPATGAPVTSVGVPVSIFLRPDASLRGPYAADTYCAGLGARLPTQSELLQQYAAAPNGQMCSVNGWALPNSCGGGSGHGAYYSSEVAAGNTRRGVRMYDGLTFASTSSHGTACVRR